jgi:uncharacterized protein (TIGR03067 family)
MLAHILLTLAVLGADPKADLEGTYVPTAGQENGKAMPEDQLKDTSVVIHRDWITVYDARTGEQMDFQFRVTADRGIDMKAMGGPDDGKVSHGMFETEGKRLRITYFPAGNSQRPTSFEAKAGSGQMMFELQKVAP